MQTPQLTYPDHIKAILRLGVPLILSNLAQFMIHMTDTIMLGWYSITALAASTLGATLFFVTFIVGAGFAQAVTPMVAEAAERDDVTHARRVTRMGLWLSVIYGAVFTLPFYWSETILLAIGQDPQVASLAQDYLVIVAVQMIPALIVMTLKAFLVALEHAAVILWATIGTALLNIPVNYMLIFGNWGAPELGIRGAAIASLIVTAVTVVWLLVYILRNLGQFELLRNIWRSDWDIFARVFRLGWPIGLTSLAEGGLFTAATVMMGWLSTVQLAAHGVALQLASAMFMIHIGLSQAATVRAGRALGRQDEAGLRRGGIAVLGVSLVFVILTIIMFLTVPELLISVFLDPDDPARDAVIAYGVILLAVAGLFQLVDAAQVMALGLLRGVQDTRVPFILAVVSYWVIGMPVSYALGFVMDLEGVGIWLGLVVGLTVASISLLWRFWGQAVFISISNN